MSEWMHIDSDSIQIQSSKLVQTHHQIFDYQSNERQFERKENPLKLKSVKGL